MTMPDRGKIMSFLEGLAEPDWRVFHSDSEVQNIAKSALAMLKEDCHNCKLECLLQKYDDLKEKYDELLKEQEIVRCKDCFYGEVEPDDNSYFFCTHPLHKLESHESSYFCADGEAKDDA